MTAKRRAPGPWQGSQAPQTDTSLAISLPLEGLSDKACAPSWDSEGHQANRADNLLQTALGYVRRGWALLPLLPGRKEPYSDLLPKDRTGAPSWRMLALQPATEAEVREWFRRDPSLNIGVIPEASGGLVVVDVDRAPARPLHLPPTATVVTARGGHYYFQASRPVPTIKCGWGEIRAAGAYVVAAGSLHPSGNRYTWADFCSPEEIHMADFPEDLLRRAEEDRDRQQRTRAQVSKTQYPPEGASPGYTGTRLPETAPAVTFDYYTWVSREDVALSILKACGVSRPKLGKAFRCPLPGHQERKPSAALYRQPDGVINLHDFHCRSGNEWYSLAEVYASVQSGRLVRLGPGEKSVWLRRALTELGYIRAPAVMAPKLPQDAPEIVKDVYVGFQKLLSVRTLYNSEDIGAPYSWRFASTWCARSERHTGEAIRWLLARGYLRTVGEPGQSKRSATLLALGTPREGE